MKLSDSPLAEKTDDSHTVDRRFDHDIREILADRGLSEEVLLATAMELYIPHPGIETREKAEIIFKRELDIALSDPNLCILIYSGIQLEEAGTTGLLPNLSRDSYDRDLAFLICDEVLGMSIAAYIAGHKGTFEYVRFDKKKPGILKNLGPFMDDVIAALIGGVSSNMYTRAEV